MPSTTLDLLDDETRPDATPRPRPPARRIALWAAAVATTVWMLLLLGGVLDNSSSDGIWLHVALNAWAVSWVVAGVDWVSHHNTLAAIRIVRADLDAHHQQATVMAAELAAVREQVGALTATMERLGAQVEDAIRQGWWHGYAQASEDMGNPGVPPGSVISLPQRTQLPQQRANGRG